MQTLKQQAHAMVDQLPDGATWDDLIERAKFLKAVAEGIDAANRGEFASDDAVQAAFANWGVDASS